MKVTKDMAETADLMEEEMKEEEKASSLLEQQSKASSNSILSDGRRRKDRMGAKILAEEAAIMKFPIQDPKNTAEKRKKLELLTSTRDKLKDMKEKADFFRYGLLGTADRRHL